MKANLLIALLLSAWTWGPRLGLACDCTPLSPQAAYDSVDYVLVGTCVQTNTNWISGGMKYSFQVDSCWKKPTDRLFIVNTPFEKDCGVAFVEGEKYLVYVRRIFTPKTNQCLGSKPLSEAEADLAFLGKGVPPQSSDLIQPMYWTLGGLGLFSVLALAFIVLRNRKRVEGSK